MMKKIIGCIVILVLSLKLNAQSNDFVKASFNGEFEKYIFQRIMNPQKFRTSYKSGFAEIDFRINRNGKLDAIQVVRMPDESLAKDLISVLASTKHMWTASKLNGKPIAYGYKLIIQYMNSTGPRDPNDLSKRSIKRAEKKLKQKKTDKALSIINKAIDLNPYNNHYYSLRAKINGELGLQKEKEADEKLSLELKRKILGNLLFVSYSNVKTISTTTTRTTRTTTKTINL